MNGQLTIRIAIRFHMGFSFGCVWVSAHENVNDTVEQTENMQILGLMRKQLIRG